MELWVIFIAFLFEIVMLQIRRNKVTITGSSLFNFIISLYIMTDGIISSFDMLLRPLTSPITIISSSSVESFIFFVVFSLSYLAIWYDVWGNRR